MMRLSSEIPRTPRPTPLVIRLLWGYVHYALYWLSYKYSVWSGSKWDNQIIYLPFGLVLKWTDRSRIEEAQAMQVMRAAGFPVPRVICYAEHPWKRHAPISILMTRMPGREFNDVYDSLQPEELEMVLKELKMFLDTMRSWRNPWGTSRICSVSGGVIRGSRIPFHLGGPFDDEEQLNDYLIDPASTEGYKTPLAYEKALSRAKALRSIPHKIVFTHGDLASHNILVHNGHLSAILDWEAAGWLPEYWEFTTAARLRPRGSWWYECVKCLGLENYLRELDSDNALYGLTSCTFYW